VVATIESDEGPDSLVTHQSPLASVDTTSTYDTVLPPCYRVDNVTVPGVARPRRDFRL